MLLTLQNKCFENIWKMISDYSKKKYTTIPKNYNIYFDTFQWPNNLVKDTTQHLLVATNYSVMYTICFDQHEMNH